MPATDLEEMIKQLPENFPQALPIIQIEIAPIIAECDPGLKDHYISLIKKRTKAASKRAVQLEIEKSIIRLSEEDIKNLEECYRGIFRLCLGVSFDRGFFQGVYRSGSTLYG
ncbi:MAG: hypothetical protein WAO07_13565 [Desulfobacterales bacterium]